MSWLVAPQCTNSPARSGSTALKARSSGTIVIELLMYSPIESMSRRSALAYLLMMSAFSFGMTPSSPCACASAASVSSHFCTQAFSEKTSRISSVLNMLAKMRLSRTVEDIVFLLFGQRGMRLPFVSVNEVEPLRPGLRRSLSTGGLLFGWKHSFRSEKTSSASLLLSCRVSSLFHQR